MKTKNAVAPISPEADRAKRGAAGELPSTAGVYTRSFVEPRPNPNHFAHPADYARAVAKWKAEYPNMHTIEEEAMHLASMAKLRDRAAMAGKGGAA